jgi:hypothetical protein
VYNKKENGGLNYPNFFKIVNPSSQLVWPEVVFMCPASPMFINSLPQLSAKNLALFKETQMSFELATTIELKFNLLSGTGENPFVGKV